MWRHFFGFELRFWLRGWMVWIFLLVVSLMIFGAVASDNIVVGGALQNTHRNAPFVIQNYYAIMTLLTLLMTTAFVNSAAARDFTSNTDQIVFTTPIRKFDFIFGRFIASALISVIPILGVSIGVITGKFTPWIDAARWGSIHWPAHLYGILLFAIPNTLFIAAIVFAIAALSRSTAMSFLGALLLLTGYGVSQALMSDLKNENVAAMLDPFGLRAFGITTKYWTVAERNTMVAGFSGLLLWNRLIWMTVGIVVLMFAYWRFNFSAAEAGPGLLSRLRRRRAVVESEEPVAVPEIVPQHRFAGASTWRQFLRITRTEFSTLVKTTSFIVILAAALLNTIPSLIVSANEGFGNTSLPVTYRMIEVVQGSLYLFMMVLITYFAGVLVWKERDTRMDEIQDVLPYPEWISYVAKFIALIISLYLIQLLVMASAILTQAFSGYHRYQFGLYVSELLAMDFSFFIYLAILAFFCHTLSPNKYVGYFAYIAFLIANLFVWRQLHVATNMVQFAGRPNETYSDFFGFAPYTKGWGWFTLYWGAFCGLLAVLSVLFWRRGKEASWAHRMRLAVLRFGGPVPIFTALFAILFIGSGAWIFYNTKVLNTIITDEEQQIRAADYERTYKKYENLPQPRITDVRYNIDLVPETRNGTMTGDEQIVNKTSQPISELHFTLMGLFDTDIQLPGATLQSDDKRLNYRIYKLSPPLAPGEARNLHFTVKTRTRGFENEVSMIQIVQNGTFFNNTIAPQIGYQAGRELDDRNDRKKRHLQQKQPMPELEYNCTEHCSNTYLSNNSDWVNVETVISTVPDQIAVAPGSLIREWQQNGRRYFQYKLDHSSLNFYSFISANYQVLRDKWNGIDVEVYYLKEHPWNIDKMKHSIEKSFEYYTKNFGPYTHKEARIIEFPRIARFAQAFPGTMPYSESLGFIANLKKPDDIDHVFYVVAHEMAHQWWAHQVIGANMLGATTLSETLAQYSALMVMEKEYGRDMMRKFLKYEMDNYLRSRGREQLQERPLFRVAANQGYIHYNKGSVVMYYLREMIGEDAVNRALRNVLQQYAYKDPPYPTSYALVGALRQETPKELRYLIEDLFQDMTLFSNRALTAKAKKRADGKYDVTVEVETKKFKADENGNEREVPIADWIEIGAMAAPPKGHKYGKVLHREKVHVTSTKGTYSFTVDEVPEKAGVDPLNLLIDRVPDDNVKNVDVS